jgi:hypothetical protein
VSTTNIPTVSEVFDLLLIETVYNNGNSPDIFIRNVLNGIVIATSHLPIQFHQFLFGWM